MVEGKIMECMLRGEGEKKIYVEEYIREIRNNNIQE